MQFDSGSGTSPPRPRKESQTQTDQRRIQCVTQLWQIGIDGMISIEFGRSTHEHLSHGGHRAPVTMFVGIGEISASQACTKPGIISASGPCVETDDQIAQPFTTGELEKTQRQKVVIGREAAHTALGRESFHTASKLLRVQGGHYLSKNTTGTGHEPNFGSPSRQVDHTHYQRQIPLPIEDAHLRSSLNWTAVCLAHSRAPPASRLPLARQRSCFNPFFFPPSVRRCTSAGPCTMFPYSRFCQIFIAA